MKLSKWKLMALIIPAAWTSISYAYDWNDDVTQRVQTLIENAANKYVQGDYDSYNYLQIVNKIGVLTGISPVLRSLTLGSTTNLCASVFAWSSFPPNNETTTDTSEEFQNQLMPKWAHSRSKEEAFQFAITRITSS